MAVVCCGKRKGGLDVKSLLILKKALFCKWSWHFVSKRGAFWYHVIVEKYGEERGGVGHSGGERGVWGWVVENDKEELRFCEK